MESVIQGMESIERVEFDLESVLVQLESVHGRILPRNTKFSCFLGYFFGVIWIFCGLGESLVFENGTIGQGYSRFTWNRDNQGWNRSMSELYQEILESGARISYVTVL